MLRETPLPLLRRPMSDSPSHFRWNLAEHLAQGQFLLKWLAIAAPVGIVVGSAVAFFLWSLDRVTELRWEHPWLLYLLPVAGLLSGLVYHYLGAESERGNNLILEQIHQPGGGVPWLMAPLVLFGTLLTHLFGGSAGREGTAVQMGGSIAGVLGSWLLPGPADARLLLMCGVAAGFGAVFGTPLAGAVFAAEVLVRGRLNHAGLIPCLIASIVGDQTNTAWGVGHTHYHIASVAQLSEASAMAPLDWLLAGKVVIAAGCFGLVSVLFAQLCHLFAWLYRGFIPWPWLRPAVGGCVVIVLVWIVGTRDYLGLGVSPPPGEPGAVTIQSAFVVGGAAWLSWWWKTLFTAVTVSSGFKGGEVTPLFFIGATLGNVLGVLLGAPVDLMAGLGFVAVFAGATNTPFACTIMAIELFAPGSGGLLESGFLVYAALACFLSYLLSGTTCIYLSQRCEGEDLSSDAAHSAIEPPCDAQE